MEQDFDEICEGEAACARDAFQGLRLRYELMAVKRGAVVSEVSAERAVMDDERRARHARSGAVVQSRAANEAGSSRPGART